MELPGEDEQADMYQLAREVLQGAGYEHYEISTSACPATGAGTICSTGITCPSSAWAAVPPGILAAAATRTPPMWKDTSAPGQKGKPPYLTWEEVGRDQEMDETMMVGMRLLEGVSVSGVPPALSGQLAGGLRGGR